MESNERKITRYGSGRYIRHKSFYNRPCLFTGMFEDKVTTIELFFDLAFVAAILNIADFMKTTFSQNPTVSILSVALIYSAFWWTWMGLNEYVTRFETDDLFHSFFFFLQFAATAGMGALMPASGFGVESSLKMKGFAVCVVISRVCFASFHSWTYYHLHVARDVTRYFIVGNTISAVLWLVSVFVPDRVSVVTLWAVGLLVEGALVVRANVQSSAKKVPIRRHHTAERHGLLVMVLLGETIIKLVQTPLTDDEGAVFHIAVLVWGVILAFCLQLLYYEVQPDTAQEDHALKRGALQAWMFVFSHLLLQIALVCVGVGIQSMMLNSRYDINFLGKSEVSVKLTKATWLLFGGVFVSILMLNVVRLSHKGGKLISELLKDAVVSEDTGRRRRTMSVVERSQVSSTIRGEKRKMWLVRFLCSLLLLGAPLTGYARVKPWVVIALHAVVTLLLVVIDAYGRSVAWVTKALAMASTVTSSRRKPVSPVADESEFTPPRLVLAVENSEESETHRSRMSSLSLSFRGRRRSSSLLRIASVESIEEDELSIIVADADEATPSSPTATTAHERHSAASSNSDETRTLRRSSSRPDVIPEEEDEEVASAQKISGAPSRGHTVVSLDVSEGVQENSGARGGVSRAAASEGGCGNGGGGGGNGGGGGGDGDSAADTPRRHIHFQDLEPRAVSQLRKNSL